MRTCLLPQSGGENTTDNLPRYVRDPSSVPARDAWYADSAKVFDNLYFVGGKIHSSWALTTSDGIIIIDTIYPYNSEELIVGGLTRLGLDPEDIKYVIIAHAHGDHIGGSEMLQSRYGAQVVMGSADWDLVEKYPNRYQSMAPKRDVVAADGMEITLGDTSVTLWETPGHTPGTLSFTFTALDNGRPVNVAYSGGTGFNFVNNTPDPGIRNFDSYIASQRHMAAQAAATAQQSFSRITRSSTARSARTACSPVAATVRIRTRSGRSGSRDTFRCWKTAPGRHSSDWSRSRRTQISRTVAARDSGSTGIVLRGSRQD